MPLTRGRIPSSGPFTTDSTQLAKVENLAALAALVDADLCWVESLLCYFHRAAASTLAPDGITVIAAAAGGNWERIVETTAPDWLSQLGWWIDPATGSDEGAGTAAAPLKTFAEFQRRVSVGTLISSVVITVVAGAAAGDVLLDVDLGLNSLTVRGAATTVLTDTLASYADFDPTTPETTLITATGIADWSAYEGMRIRMTDGAAVGAVAWIARADPHSAGVDVASVSRFTAADGTPATPGVADSFVVETLPSIGYVSVRARAVGSGPSTERIRFESVKMPQHVSFETLLGDSLHSVVIDQCQIEPGAPTSAIQLNGGANGAPLWLLRSSIQNANGGTLANTSTHGCLLRAMGAAFAFLGGAQPELHVNLLCDDAGLAIWGNEIGFSDLQSFNCAAVAYAIQTRCAEVVFADSVSGDGNGIGLQVGAANGPQPATDVAYDTTYNLQGTGADIQISGAAQVLAVADLPYNGDSQAGTATLVAGTATVTARNSARGVQLTRNTPAGAAMGLLSAPVASRTGTQFVINAEDITGSGVVVTDVSTVDWFIPEQARGVRIYNSLSAAAAG